MHRIRCLSCGQRCTYKHPYFRAGRADLLGELRRQTSPEQRYTHNHSDDCHHTYSPRESPSPYLSEIESLKAQVEALTQSQESMTTHIQVLEKKYSEVLMSLAEVETNSTPLFPSVQSSSSSQLVTNLNQIPSEPSTFGPAGDLAMMGFAFGNRWEELFPTLPSDMFTDIPSVSSPCVSISTTLDTLSPNGSNGALDQRCTDAMILQSLIDANSGLVPCGGVRRAREDSDRNDAWAGWKRLRV